MTRTITPTRGRSSLRILVVLLLAVTGALLAGAGPASAHAALTGSDPAQGVVVKQAPSQVSLTFSEKVAMNDDSLRVLDPRGKPVQSGKPGNVSGTTYAVRLKSGLGKGTYTVTYQVVSADSHPVSGAYTFSIGAPSQTVVSGTGPVAGGGVVGGLYALGRYASYAGFIVLAGGAAFVLACWQRGAGVRALQRLVVGGWLTLTAATLWLLLLRGSYTTSGKAADVFDLGLLGQVLQTKTGAALVSRLLLLAAAALFIAVLFGAYTKREEGQEKRDLTFGLAIGGVVVAAGLATSWAMAEHASVGLQPGIAMPVDVVHLLAVAAWLGGLTALLVALYRAPAETPVEVTAVARFSRMAFGSVLALVATGTYQSWRQLGSWSAFTDTRYGQLLLVKIGLVALLVGIASVSRRWTGRLADTAAVTPEQSERERVASGAAKRSTGSGTAEQSAKGKTSGDPRRAEQLARQRAAMDAARQKRLRDGDTNRFGLRRTVLAEAGVAVVLLAVTTWLTQTEPGRTELEAKAAGSSSSPATAPSNGALTLDMPFDTGGSDGKGVVSIDLDPARVGGNEMHVYVQRPGGQAFDIPEVKVAFTLEAKKIGPLPVTPDHITTGHWSASGVQIPMAGDWKIAVTVRTSDIDQVTVSKNAQIG
ncbi:copper resistance CopC/CopD family protein [Streptomyces roseochromogenus]|uniref:Protein YobA n=1 Tax=Streptomyces roseochromogenus subsp. oscitans DS 12.976 TaxID=1352936 RepID=V6KB72_STRRC|nr:copper resistance protein CopC [Streptomyces roseochromogenus]EST28661.1 membrane protein [Streptomyces roseochromogenus subsp. oscitans DS 12.976]